MHRHDVDRMLVQAGYQLVRTRGGHHIYRNEHNQTITLVAHGRRTFAAPEVRVIQEVIAARAEERRQMPLRSETRPAEVATRPPHASRPAQCARSPVRREPAGLLLRRSLSTPLPGQGVARPERSGQPPHRSLDQESPFIPHFGAMPFLGVFTESLLTTAPQAVQHPGGVPLLFPRLPGSPRPTWIPEHFMVLGFPTLGSILRRWRALTWTKTPQQERKSA